MKFLIITLLLALGCVAAVQAQSVWRCGPDSSSYADSPCRDGQAVTLAEARPGADVAQAQQLARRERALAARLTQERQRRESPGAPALTGIHGSRLAAPAALKPTTQPRSKAKRRPEAADTWRATAPASRHSKG